MANNYWQALKDPRWQRKRLETLEAARWECENCGEKENTLHVHHKRYIKGRNPWEYEADDLMVLCEDCHESYHQIGERLKELIARVNPFTAFSVLAGFWYSSDWIDRGLIEEGRQQDPLAFAAGFVADLVNSNCEISTTHKVAEFAVSLTKETSEVRQILEHSQHIFGKDE